MRGDVVYYQVAEGKQGRQVRCLTLVINVERRRPQHSLHSAVSDDPPPGDLIKVVFKSTISHYLLSSYLCANTWPF